MDERFFRLFAQPTNLYCAGSPVIIVSGELYKDNLTGGIFAQCVFRNAARLPIKALTARFQPLDTTGAPLGRPGEYQYLDLMAPRDVFFGQESPVYLPDSTTRGFKLSIGRVVFADNSVWTPDEDAAWEQLPMPEPLAAKLGDAELMRQYALKYGADSAVTYAEFKDLWRCNCGAINHEDEPACFRCGKERAAIASPDLEALKSERDERLKHEAEMAEKARAEAEERKKANVKKAKKLAKIITPIVILLIAGAIYLGWYMNKSDEYDAALALLEAGEEEEAVEAFTALGSFKDSRQQIYNLAAAKLEDGDYDGAAELFTGLGDYEDSADQVNNVWYTKADRLLAGIDKSVTVSTLSDYDEAYELFSGLGDYSDSAERAAAVQAEAEEYKQDVYDECFELIESGNVETAKNYFKALGEFGYKDSAEIFEEIERQEDVLDLIHDNYFTYKDKRVPMHLPDIQEALNSLETGNYGLLLESDAQPYQNFIDMYLPFYGKFELVDSSPIVYNAIKIFDATPNKTYEFTQYGEGNDRYYLEIEYYGANTELDSMEFVCTYGYTNFSGETSSDIYGEVNYSLTLTDEGNVRITANFEDDYGNEYTQWIELAKVEE